MGCLLTLVWASLRWSDALWIAPSALHEDGDTIRGVASKTKTTTRGMPFAFIMAGFMSGPSSCNWATKWLNLVRAALQRTAEMYPHFDPDFLIPQCGPNLDHPMFVAPMPRAQGILLLRCFMLMSSKDAPTLSIGVHSAKVTFLSWARQLGISEEARMSQGHHRLAGAHQNVALYGRDDVHAALDLQRQVRLRIAAGFRPVIPMLRGGTKPVHDVPVDIPAVSAPDEPAAVLNLCLPDLDDLVDTDSGASEPEVPDAPQGGLEPAIIASSHTDFLFLLNEASGVAHVAAVCPDDDPCCVVTVRNPDVARSFKFACNVRRSANDKVIRPVETFPSQYRLCMRPACAHVFD